MKTLMVLLVTILSVSVSHAETCAEKIAAVETKIAHAKKAGNQHQVQGLEKALVEAKANCMDEGLKSAHDAKVQDKAADVEKARTELEKAKADGKSKKKLEKKQKKLDEKTQELEAAKAGSH